MKTEHTETETITKTIVNYKCDVCGMLSEHCMARCCFCGRHLCNVCKHSFSTDSNLRDDYPHTSGDYPDYYICMRCWEDNKEIRNRIQDVRDKAEANEEAIWKEWKERMITKKLEDNFILSDDGCVRDHSKMTFLISVSGELDEAKAEEYRKHGIKYIEVQ